MQHDIEKINFKWKDYMKEQPSEANYLFTIEKICFLDHKTTHFNRKHM